MWFKKLFMIIFIYLTSRFWLFFMEFISTLHWCVWKMINTYVQVAKKRLKARVRTANTGLEKYVIFPMKVS